MHRPCSAPSENRSATPFSTLDSGRLGLFGAFVSPKIVTVELSVPSKLALVWIVTVMVLAAPASGVLWPILRTSNTWWCAVCVCECVSFQSVRDEVFVRTSVRGWICMVRQCVGGYACA